MPHSTHDPVQDPVVCRHCGSAGTIGPNPTGRGRPQFTWTRPECSGRQHKATKESLVAATDAWWARERPSAERRAREAALPTRPPPHEAEPERAGRGPVRVLGLVLFLVVLVWLLARGPIG